jgi:hypothetical protein
MTRIRKTHFDLSVSSVFIRGNKLFSVLSVLSVVNTSYFPRGVIFNSRFW